MTNATLLAGLAVVLLVFAGCAAPSASQGGSTPEPVFDEATGGIHGVVTDDQLLPVPLAVVVLDATTQTETDNAGTFAFGKVTPGKHVLTVGAIGFEDAQAEVDIIAGEATRVRIGLTPVGSHESYYEIFPKSGLIECSFGYRVPSVPGRYFAACAAPTFVGLSSPDNSLNAFNEIGFGEDVTAIVVETSWSSTQALGTRMEIVLYVHDVPLPDPTGDYGSTSPAAADEGESPLWHAVNRTELDAVVKGDGTSLCADHVCYFEIGHNANADQSAAVDVKIILQQRFDDFVTVFHGPGPYEDFSALPDA